MIARLRLMALSIAMTALLWPVDSGASRPAPVSAVTNARHLPPPTPGLVAAQTARNQLEDCFRYAAAIAALSPGARPDHARDVARVDELAESLGLRLCAAGDAYACARTSVAIGLGERPARRRDDERAAVLAARSLKLQRDACRVGEAGRCAQWSDVTRNWLYTVPADGQTELARALAYRACELGAADGCLALAVAIRGRLVPFAEELAGDVAARALALARRDCEAGRPDGCRTWRDLIDEGLVEGDRRRVVERACAAGSGASCAHLGTISDLDHGMEMMRAACHSSVRLRPASPIRPREDAEL